MNVQRKPSTLLPGKAQGSVLVSLIQEVINDACSRLANLCKAAIGSVKQLFFKRPKPKDPLIIFLLGPPGAGKGTQVSLLKKSFPEVSYISFGDLVRQEDSIPGSWVSSLPRRGGGSKSPVVPPEAAVHILYQAIFNSNGIGQKLWLIDGFPRTKKHVEAWVKGRMPLAQCVIYLTCPEDVLIQRILSRASTSGRPDDAVPDLVKERVERNISERDAMLSALVEHDMPFVKIDGTQDVETVRRTMLDTFMGTLNTWKQV